MDIDEKQTDLLRCVEKCIRGKFKYGAKPEEAPNFFDCSSLSQYIYKNIDILLPRRSIQQASLGVAVSLNDLRIGDLLFFHGTVGYYNSEFPKGIGHVAIYIGNHSVIQASGREKEVIITPMVDILKRDDFIVAKRIL